MSTVASPSSLLPFYGRHTIALRWIAITVVVLISASGWFILQPRLEQGAERSNPVRVGENLPSCMHQLYQFRSADNPDISELYQVFGLCYNSTIAQLVVEEEAVRRDNFVFQRAENVALLIMVITITLSGVVLAGLQLLGSYKLALARKGQLVDGGEASLKPDSIVVKSSVVGVVILAISFAFFMVFVVYVYTLRDDTAPGPGRSPTATQPSPTSSLLSQPPQKQSNPTPTGRFNLNPVLNPAQGPSASDTSGH
jgi:hypothetical protein